MKRNLTIWLVSLALIVASIIVLVYWVDEPLALLNFELFGRWRPAVAIIEAPALSIPLAAGAVFIAFGLRSLCVDHISKIETAIFLSGVSVIVADAIKGQLKFVFGRAWPVSWKAGTISLINNGEHGFHFFRSGLDPFRRVTPQLLLRLSRSCGSSIRRRGYSARCAFLQSRSRS